MTQQDEINAIKMIVIGNAIANYGAIKLKSDKSDLKKKVENLISASKKVKSWFLFHPNSTPAHKEQFKKEMNSSELNLIASINIQLTSFNEDGLEDLHRQLEEIINRS